MSFSPGFAHSRALRQPSHRGQYQRPGDADSAVFPEWAAPVPSVTNGAKRLGALR